MWRAYDCYKWKDMETDGLIFIDYNFIECETVSGQLTGYLWTSPCHGVLSHCRTLVRRAVSAIVITLLQDNDIPSAIIVLVQRMHSKEITLAF